MMQRRGFLGMLIAAVAGVFGVKSGTPVLQDGAVVIRYFAKRPGKDFPLFRTPDELNRLRAGEVFHVPPGADLRVVGTMESMPEYWIRAAQAAFKEGKGHMGIDRSC